MLLLVEVALAAAIVFAVAALVVGRLDGLTDAPPDQADFSLPTGRLLPPDVDETRFGLVLRGYRMSEVDDVLDRLADELTARDAEIALRDRDLAALRQRLAESEDRQVAIARERAALEAELTTVRDKALEMPTAPKPYVTTSFPPIRDEPAPETPQDLAAENKPEQEPDPEQETGAPQAHRPAGAAEAELVERAEDKAPSPPTEPSSTQTWPTGPSAH